MPESVGSRRSSGNIRDGSWQTICSAVNLDFLGIKKIRVSTHSKSSNDIRNGSKGYFNSENETVEWQLKYVRSIGNDE